MAYEIVPAGRMKDSPVPPYQVKQPNTPDEIVLQDPAYFPDILPIYPMKMDTHFYAPEGTGENIPNPPDPPPPDPGLKVRANVDEPFRPVAGNETQTFPPNGPQFRGTGGPAPAEGYTTG